MRMLFVFVVLSCVFFSSSRESLAQFSAQKDAAYLATLKAVTDFKINDDEVLKDIEKLRQNEKFNQDLQKMLYKLTNSRTKTGKNRRVYQILQRAGKEIYDELSR